MTRFLALLKNELLVYFEGLPDRRLQWILCKNATEERYQFKVNSENTVVLSDRRRVTKPFNKHSLNLRVHFNGDSKAIFLYPGAIAKVVVWWTRQKWLSGETV